MEGAGAWGDQAEAIRAAVADSIAGVLGIYLHGSAALGGFGPASDLDVLVVVDASGSLDWDAVGRHLLVECAGGYPVELSVVEQAAAARPAEPWPFLLHVNSGDGRSVVSAGGGDPDLIAHYAVVRAAGITLRGREPRELVGSVDRAVLLDYLVGELKWGCAEADQRYAVLNACRAVAYAEDDVLVSKLAGGQWWLDREGTSVLVSDALAAQRAGTDLGPCGDAAGAFVAAAIARLHHAVPLII